MSLTDPTKNEAFTIELKHGCEGITDMFCKKEHMGGKGQLHKLVEINCVVN